MNQNKTIIPAFPRERREIPKGSPYLKVSEFFCDTIQGEGIYLGVPATFLRLQGCTLDCVYCDTEEVWRVGNPYTFETLFQLMEEFKVISKLQMGQHLVITGGSPLKQQDNLLEFLNSFKIKYGFIPFIEIENECVIKPRKELVNMVSCWNNSPKLEASKNPMSLAFNEQVLLYMASLTNSWFKFVIYCEEDWNEIKFHYIDTLIISRDLIVLMPLGATREELEMYRQLTVDIAIRENVRYCSREHIVLWDKKTGV